MRDCPSGRGAHNLFNHVENNFGKTPCNLCRSRVSFLFLQNLHHITVACRAGEPNPRADSVFACTRLALGRVRGVPVYRGI
jgi:hypothetical protein